MSKIVKVQTGAGLLQVTQRVNADNEFTGRIDGTTYVGKTWAAVEDQIRKRYTDQRVWTRYIILSAHDPEDDENHHFHHEDTTHARAEIRYRTAEASQVLMSDGVSGIWTRTDAKDRPWFSKGATSAEDAFGSDDSAVMAWTPELAEQAERLRLAVRELAHRLHTFVRGKDIVQRLLTGSSVLALPAPPAAEPPKRRKR